MVHWSFRSLPIQSLTQLDRCIRSDWSVVHKNVTVAGRTLGARDRSAEVLQNVINSTSAAKSAKEGIEE